VERSAFFNSVSGDRKYKAEAFAGYFSKFITNGIFPLPADNLRIAAYDRMQIKAQIGTGYINGYLYENTDTLILTVPTANGLKPRIDSVVLRWSQVDRNIRIYVKEGTPDNTPSPPALERTPDAYELGLANILIPQGAYQITEAEITDTRLDTKSCGIVNSILQADTTAIFNQYQSWFSQMSGRYDTELQNSLARYDQNMEKWLAEINLWGEAKKQWYQDNLTKFIGEYTDAREQWLKDINTWFTTTADAFEIKLSNQQQQYTVKAEDYLKQIESLIGATEAGELLNKVRYLQENLGFIPIDAGDFFETYIDFSPDGGEF
jgi:hypothetical protein